MYCGLCPYTLGLLRHAAASQVSSEPPSSSSTEIVDAPCLQIPEPPKEMRGSHGQPEKEAQNDMIGGSEACKYRRSQVVKSDQIDLFIGLPLEGPNPSAVEVSRIQVCLSDRPGYFLVIHLWLPESLVVGWRSTNDVEL